MDNDGQLRTDSKASVIGTAVAAGVAVVLAGTIPRNIFFFLNLRYGSSVPWAVPIVAVYLWLFWKYLKGTRARRDLLRANHLSARAWAWALTAGFAGIVALVLALRLAGHFVALPQQRLPDLSGVGRYTAITLLLAGAPIAGLIEEAAFRGYMQGPIERRCGLSLAILITGTVFALVHLDFTPYCGRTTRPWPRSMGLLPATRIRFCPPFCCTPPAIPIRTSISGCTEERSGRQCRLMPPHGDRAIGLPSRRSSLRARRCASPFPC